MSDRVATTQEDRRRVAEHRLAREIAFDAIVTADAAGAVSSINASAVELLGYAHDAVCGRPIGTLFADASQMALEQVLELARRGDPARRELLAQHARGSTVPVEARVAAVRDAGASGFVLVARDLTRVKKAEDELRLSDRAVGELGAELSGLRRIAAAVATGADPDSVFSLVAREVADLHGVEHGTVIRFTGRRRATIVGEWTAGRDDEAPLPRSFGLRQDSSVRRAMRTGAPARLTEPADAGDGRVESLASPIHLESALWGVLAISTSRAGALAPVAEQRITRFAGLVAPSVVEAEARNSLARQAAEQLALATIGEHALASADIESLFASAVKIVADTLRVERVRILKLLADEGEFEVRARSGRPGRVAGPLRVPIAPRSLIALALDADVPVGGVSGSEGVTERAPDAAARSSIAVAIRLREGPWGVLEAESRQSSHFGPSDPHFLRGFANVLASAIERRRAEDVVRFQALHDPLTGIANRTLLGDRLAIALERAGRVGRKVAVMLIDIDRFKTVNDTRGHTEGDAILVAIAQRLSDVVQPGDSAARIGGDEFALYEEVGSEREAAALAERVVRAFRPRLAAAGGISLTASVGVVMRGAGDSPEVALRDAHTATQRAKANGRDRFEVFDASMRTRLIERRGVENDLRRAIEHGEIVVYYQPIVSLEHGNMDGVEALARWAHPERGLLGPREFISVAEETGLIVALGLEVLESACREAAGWNERRRGNRPLHVSVNLSALQLAEPTTVADVTRIAERWGPPAGQLGLEITETVVLDDDRTHVQRLSAFREAGIRVILDDFGTGYSSLSYLRRLPLDVLKLDRSFVTGIVDDPGAIAIVAAVIRIADTLALSVVAEGVETSSELRTLEALGCQLIQGYFFARPMSAAKLERLLVAPPPWLTRGRSQETA